MSKIFVLVFALVIGGCTTVGVNLPTSRLESPEANRDWHPRVSTGVSRQQAMIYTRDASRRPLNIHDAESEDSIEYGWIKAGIGLPIGFEFSGKVGTINGTSAFIAKYQILGPRAGEGKEGDTSLAVTGSVLGGENNVSGDQNGIFGAGGHNWSAKQIAHGRDVAVIVGHRVTDRIIIFGGPFYTDWEFHSRVKQDASDNGLSPEATYDYYGRGNRKGVSLAMEWSTLAKVKFFFTPEIIYSRLHWTNNEEATHIDWAIATGVLF